MLICLLVAMETGLLSSYLTDENELDYSAVDVMVQWLRVWILLTGREFDLKIKFLKCDFKER